MDVLLLKGAAILYLAGAGAFVVYAALQKDLLARVSPVVLLAGFLLHGAALSFHFFHFGYPPVTEFREALSLFSWAMVGVYLLAQLKYRLAVLGCVVAPLAFLMSLGAVAFGAGGGELPPGLKTYWVPLHVTLAMLGNAVFTLAFAVSLMYLILEYRLKTKRTTVLYKGLPSLETLDRLNYVFLVWGFPLMTLGILAGSFLARARWGNYWSWDPRQISSAITWLLYGSLLQGRVAAGWRGRKAALLTIVGFVVVLGYFLWGSALFPSRHAGSFE